MSHLSPREAAALDRYLTTPPEDDELDCAECGAPMEPTATPNLYRCPDCGVYWADEDDGPEYEAEEGVPW